MWGEIASIGGSLLSGMFGDDAADDAGDAAREAAAVRAAAADEGAAKATTSFNDWYATAKDLNQPGLDAYGAAMGTLTPLLTKGQIVTPQYGSQQQYLARQQASLRTMNKQMTALVNQRSTTTDPAAIAQIDAGIAQLKGNIAKLNANVKGAQAKMKALATSGKAQMTTEQWLQKVDPGYQARYQKGQDAVAARQSAGKDRFSGRALLEAQREGQTFASNEFGHSVNRLMQLAGYGDTATGRMTAGAFGTGSGIANAAMGAARIKGEATAGGIEGAANADLWSASNWMNNLSDMGATVYDRYRRSTQPDYSYSVPQGGYAGVGSPRYTGV